MKSADNFVDWFSEALKERISDLTFVPPCDIKKGDVVTVTRFAQFRRDNVDTTEFDATTGNIKMNWIFYGEGSLFVVLDRENDRVDVMALESGHTGWFYHEDLKHYA